MSEMEQQPICKIALGIEYDGSKYYGWQRQNEVRSVQEKLEKALAGGERTDYRLLRRPHRRRRPWHRPWCISKPGRSGKMPHGRWG